MDKPSRRQGQPRWLRTLTLALILASSATAAVAADDLNAWIAGVEITSVGAGNYKIKVTTAMGSNVAISPAVTPRFVLKVNGTTLVDQEATFGPIGGPTATCGSDEDCACFNCCTCSTEEDGSCTEVKDSNGNVIACVCYGCMADASFSTVYALSSGDTITAELDVDDELDELSEADNSKTVNW